MIEHLRTNWWLYWCIAASAVFIWFRFGRTDSTKSKADRMRLLLRGSRYDDPKSSSYDPGLFGRQVRLLLVGLPIIGFALLLVWLLGK
jgi:hypothetical protein